MNVLPIVRFGVLVLVAAAPPLAAQSQSGAEHDAHRPARAAGGDAAAMADGEVRKIDKSAGKITLRHGAIANLDMPQMTMVFRVRDPAMLDKVHVGDKVRFAAEKVGGQYTVTKIVPAQ